MESEGGDLPRIRERELILMPFWGTWYRVTNNPRSPEIVLILTPIA